MDRKLRLSVICPQSIIFILFSFRFTVLFIHFAFFFRLFPFAFLPTKGMLLRPIHLLIHSKVAFPFATSLLFQIFLFLIKLLEVRIWLEYFRDKSSLYRCWLNFFYFILPCFLSNHTTTHTTYFHEFLYLSCINSRHKLFSWSI